MQSPWELDADDIPSDPRERRRTRRLQIVGVLLWGLVIASVSVLLVSDTGSLSTVQVLVLAVLGLVLAVIAILIGALAIFLIKRFGFGAKIAIYLVLFLVLLTVFPVVLSWVLDTVSVFDEIPTDDDLLIDLVRRFFG